MRKIELVKSEATNGETHFQECKAKFCSTYKKYTVEEARRITREDANKPLLLNQR